MYMIAMISNLPIIMFTVRTTLDVKSKFIEVTPLVSPVVVSAETDSNNASS